MSSLKPIGETSTGAAAKPPKAKRYTIIRLAEIGGLKAKEKPTFTNEQMQRGATFNINDFDPDSAGEGALTDFERNIYNKLAPIAREGGKIGIHELYTVIEQTAKAEKEASFFSRLFIASLVLVAMLIGVNAGITGALISSYKDTYARGSVIANGDGLVMRTTPATTPLPMLAAPVLRSEQLQAVEFLTVKVADAEHNTTRKTTYRVGAVHHYNGTMITFATEVAGHEVRVWNGEAYLMANGDRFELCENDVGCSAFQVDDAVSADRILNLAIEELVAAGYRAEGEALRRRRLQTGIGECDVVEDQLAQLLNTPPSPPPPPLPSFRRVGRRGGGQQPGLRRDHRRRVCGRVGTRRLRRRRLRRRDEAQRDPADRQGRPLRVRLCRHRPDGRRRVVGRSAVGRRLDQRRRGARFRCGRDRRVRRRLRRAQGGQLGCDVGRRLGGRRRVARRGDARQQRRAEDRRRRLGLHRAAHLCARNGSVRAFSIATQTTSARLCSPSQPTPAWWCPTRSMLLQGQDYAEMSLS